MQPDSDGPSDETSERMFTFSVDTSGLIESLWKVRAALLFSWNPDLVKLDDELDITYRGQI